MTTHLHPQVQAHPRIRTAEAFWEYIQRPENRGKHLELSRGRVIEWDHLGDVGVAGGTGGQHGETGILVTHVFSSFVLPRRLGRLTNAETCYVLGEDENGDEVVRCPDLGFVRMERAPKPLPADYVPFAPDLVVEIVSPNDRARDIAEKVADYLRFEVAQVWYVYPTTQHILVHTNGGVSRYAVGDIMDVGEPLPGLRVTVADVFPV